MHFQFEKTESELTELSEYFTEHEDDAVLGPLSDKLSDSLVGIFFILAQLKPNYNLKFNAVDRQKREEDLCVEIALVCQECKVLCETNQFLADKIGKIEAYLPGGNTAVKNDTTL